MIFLVCVSFFRHVTGIHIWNHRLMLARKKQLPGATSRIWSITFETNFGVQSQAQSAERKQRETQKADQTCVSVGGRRGGTQGV